jgi:3-oxoacyl-[acyl-carrier-protein] synthase-1
MSLASMRAGVVRFVETEIRDGAGEPVRASRLQLLNPSLSRTERMTALGCEALAAVNSPLISAVNRQVPLYLGLPEGGVGARVDRDRLVATLMETAEGRLKLAGKYESGRAGFFEALAAALTDLRLGGSGTMALVGAVDSLCDAASLRAMVAEKLLLGLQNPDGRIPGEAAGFVVLAQPGAAARRSTGQEIWGQMLGVTLGSEPRPFTQREPCMAEGLTQVFRALRVDPTVGQQRVNTVLACQPGETFWAHEFSQAYLRNTALMPEPLRVHLAGEQLGDAGAGAGPAMLGMALYRPRRLPREGSRALVYGSADSGRVGACVVQVESHE